SDLEGLHPFEPVEVELMRPLSHIEHNLVAVGSHDLCLDILADLLRKRQNKVTLGSTHVGSLGGLMAIRNGTCHLAGSHLLDAGDGSYNTSFIKRYLPEVPVRVVHLVQRNQGLIVATGNPKNIDGFEDLLREDITFVNRQAGSGTRVLLDHELEARSIDPAGIIGYDTVEFTHMAVAVAVLSGAAHVGLGIRAAARALGLDFIDVVFEHYELVIPESCFHDRSIQTLLEIVNSDEFKGRVRELGGYDTSLAGQTRTIP
ncbi:MAG: molybdopterin biosynthesis protein, partial [Proteobacteria bacterium]|nr:molybdopterin biosynthesis protein [Pseudomonadota bacterium]